MDTSLSGLYFAVITVIVILLALVAIVFMAAGYWLLGQTATRFLTSPRWGNSGKYERAEDYRRWSLGYGKSPVILSEREKSDSASSR